MKILALLLFVVNLLVFAWIELGQPAPQSAPAQLHPDKISIVTAPVNAETVNPARSKTTPPIAVPVPISVPLSATTSAPAITSAPAPAPVPVPVPVSTTIPVTPGSNVNNPSALPPSATIATSDIAKTMPQLPQSVNLDCLEWGPIPAKRADDAQLRLSKLKLGNRLSYQDVAANNGPYWVYLPPLPSRQAANEKMAELQDLGIHDISVVHNGQWQNAISMGLYSNQATAKARVESMQNKDIVALIEARGKSARVFTLSNLTADEHNALRNMQTEFGGPSLKKLICKLP